MKSKKEILVYAHYFLPSKNAGGPPKSLANLIDGMKNQLKFKIMCCDHEFKAPSDKFTNISLGEWTKYGGRKVIYLPDTWVSMIKLIREGFDSSSDIIYFNSFFDVRYTILPILLLGLFSTKKIILAPRGEFSKSALDIKWRKKNIYLRLFKSLKLQTRIVWQASSLKEKFDLERYWGSCINLSVLPIFPDPELPTLSLMTHKVSGAIRLVYLARIAKIKNLLNLLGSLKLIKDSKVELDIFGPIEDSDYWKSCELEINSLPSNIKVIYRGEIEKENVINTISSYDFYVLMTKGENFGHTIYEALSASVPILISDQTPWRRLQEKNAGWDLSLEDPNKINSAIETAIKLNSVELRKMKKGAYQLASDYVHDSKRNEIALDLFRS